MDLNTILALREAGVDTEGALRRFSGNSEMYERFLKKFLSDPTFKQITETVMAKDPEGALAAAHTLKGVTANLGINKLFSISSEMVDQIRADDFDGAAGNYPRLKEAYEEICDILERG